MKDQPAPSLRIVHLLWSDVFGGIQRFVTDMALTQMKNGHEVSVALGRVDGLMAEKWKAAGIEVLDLALGSPLSPGRVRDDDPLARFDVIHLHDVNVALATRLRHVADKPVVFTEHVPIDQAGLARRVLEAFVTRRADRVVAVSEHIARLLRRLPNVDKEEITVIPNGISFPGTVIEPGSKGGPLAVACVCRLEPWKRPRLLLEAVALLNEDCSIAVSMIGSGPLEREMKALAIDLGIEDRVKVLGYRDDVSDLLAGADVLVHTARNEPFGLVILEAASVGALPIVMQDGGGALEALPPDGVVVRDASHLATTLADLAGSSALSTEARRARADWVRAHFNVDRCARRYAVVYEEAVTARMADVQS